MAVRLSIDGVGLSLDFLFWSPQRLHAPKTQQPQTIREYLSHLVIHLIRFFRYNSIFAAPSAYWASSPGAISNGLTPS